jgi:hypothetical protein
MYEGKVCIKMFEDRLLVSLVSVSHRSDGIYIGLMMAK